MNRRNFLRNSAMGLTALATAPAPQGLFANPFGMPIGLQLTLVDKELKEDLAGTLKQVAAIGIKEVEPYNLYGKTAAEWVKIMKDNGLSAPSGHYQLKDQRENWEKSIEEAKTLGLKYMVNAVIKPEDRKSFDDYKRIAELWTKSAEQTQKAGIQFCHHNHNFEFQKFGDTTAYDYFLKTLDPKLVKFEMDCFWVLHAGQDPVAYFKKHPGRFPLLHIKDMKDHPANSVAMEVRTPAEDDQYKSNLFTPLGQGTIDWKRIFAAAPTGGMKHFYIEQDRRALPDLECVKIGYDYLHSLT